MPVYCLIRIQSEVLDEYLHLGFHQLNQIQHRDEIEADDDRVWFHIFLLIDELKSAIRVLEHLPLPLDVRIVQDLMQRLSEASPTESKYYFEEVVESFQQRFLLLDLQDLERLLYFLRYTGGTKVHLYCA